MLVRPVCVPWAGSRCLYLCATALWAMSRLAVHGAYRRSACQGFGSACVLTWRHVANWQPLASRLSREKYCYG